MGKEPIRRICRTAIGANVVVGCLIAVTIFLMANYLSYRHYVRFDWTTGGYYSLSDQTVKIIESLQLPVKVYVFYQPMSPVYNDVRELLTRYADVGENFEVEVVDPEKDLARTELLLKKFKLPSRSRASIVVFEQGGKSKYVYDKDIVEMDHGDRRTRSAPRIKAFKGEQAFTSAILTLTEEKQPVACFITGHGERSVDDTSRTGLHICSALLERENIKVEKLALFDKKQLPDNCDLVLIIGPTEPYMDDEKKALGKFLKEGGRVFVALDPQSNSGLEQFLKKWDIDVGNNIVVDPASAQRLLFFSSLNLFTQDYGAHEITDGMKGKASLFAGVRSVTPGTANPELTAVPLVRTSPKGWGEVDFQNESFRFDEDDDLKGPVSIGVAVEADPGKCGDRPIKDVRVVALGDSEFISNSQITNLANANLFLNAVNWLTSRENLISIRPKMPEQLRMRLNAAQMKQIFWLVWVVLPGLAVLLGLVIWWRRRK